VHERVREKYLKSKEIYYDDCQGQRYTKDKNYLINDQLRKMRQRKREGKGRGEGNIIFHIYQRKLSRF